MAWKKKNSSGGNSSTTAGEADLYRVTESYHGRGGPPQVLYNGTDRKQAVETLKTFEARNRGLQGCHCTLEVRTSTPGPLGMTDYRWSNLMVADLRSEKDKELDALMPR